jgi:hypothetical protein
MTSLFRRLLVQVKLGLDRCMENMDDKMLKYETNELNSRQLATYARMLETVPRMCLLFQVRGCPCIEFFFQKIQKILTIFQKIATMQLSNFSISKGMATIDLGYSTLDS